MEIDVERLVRETRAHSPLEGRAPLPFLRRPTLSCSFSKDILPLGGGVAVYCHLSINHPRNADVNLGEVLDQFKEKLGEPEVTFDSHPTWTIGSKVFPAVTHHFFWKTTEEPPTSQTRFF